MRFYCISLIADGNKHVEHGDLLHMPYRVKHALAYSKHVLSGHSKIDKIKVLMENGSLMKVESIAECSNGAFCNTYDLY